MNLILKVVIFEVSEETFAEEYGSSKNQYFFPCRLHHMIIIRRFDLFIIFDFIYNKDLGSKIDEIKISFHTNYMKIPLMLSHPSISLYYFATRSSNKL